MNIFTILFSFFLNFRYLIFNKNFRIHSYVSSFEFGLKIKSVPTFKKSPICSNVVMCEMFIVIVMNYL